MSSDINQQEISKYVDWCLKNKLCIGCSEKLPKKFKGAFCGPCLERLSEAMEYFSKTKERFEGQK